MSAAGLRENTDVNMLNVGAGYGKWNQIFRLARGGAGMTADTPRLVDNFGPLHRSALWFFKHVVWLTYAGRPQTRPDQFGFW
jgi:hypothetical protein